MTPRPYQQAAREAVHAAWEEFIRLLVVMPTGTGKTILFALIIRDIINAGGRVLVLAHRGELLDQAADKIRKTTGLACAVEKAEETAHDALEMITVGSVQSLMRPQRLARFAEDHYTHIIIDEAHHCISDSYQSVARYFNGAKVLGVTATADRADKKNLGQYFETLAYEYRLIQAVRDGWLAPIRVQAMPVSIDTSGLPGGQREYTADECATALDPYLPELTKCFAEHCRDRKGLIFAPLCATAKKIQAALAAQGLRAYYCSGEDRSQIAAYEADGPGSVMVNAMLLTEGYDHPPIDLIAVWRFTKSRAFYSQMVGRGTRLDPGKENLLILDNLFLGDQHELCRPAHVMAEDPDVARKVAEAVEEAGDAGIALDEAAIDQARREVIQQREEALAKKLQEQRRKKARLVDPLQWAISVNAEDLTDYQPEFGWEAGPPSKKQLEALEKAGISPDSVQNAGMASKLMDRLDARKSAGYATPRQIRCLERFGFQHVGEMTFTEANRTITRLSANGWRLPEDLAERVRR